MDNFYKDEAVGFIAYRTPSTAYNVLDEEGNIQHNEEGLDFEQVVYATSKGRSDARFVEVITLQDEKRYVKTSLAKLAEQHYDYLKVNGSYLVNMRYARRFNSFANIFVKTANMAKPKLIQVKRGYQEEVSIRIRKRYRSL